MISFIEEFFSFKYIEMAYFTCNTIRKRSAVSLVKLFELSMIDHNDITCKYE